MVRTLRRTHRHLRRADPTAAPARTPTDGARPASGLRQEGELLELLEATMPPEQFTSLAGQYRSALADPQQVARSIAAAQRFEALAAAAPDDPAIASVASEFIAQGRTFIQEPTADASVAGPQENQVWAAYRATLSPAQQRCLALVES